MKKTCGLVAICFVVGLAAFTASSCSKDDAAPVAAETHNVNTQAGAGGKAANGGGMMPLPQAAKPGEKTGLPK